jgi:hypothetical protein
LSDLGFWWIGFCLGTGSCVEFVAGFCLC